MSTNTHDVVIQLSIAGNAETGKTLFCNRLFKGREYREGTDYHPTVGIDFMTTKYAFPSKLCAKIHIWDFAGNRDYTGIVSSYFKSSCASLFFCDVTKRSSVKDLENWYTLLEKKIGATRIHHYPIVVVGNCTSIHMKRDSEENNEAKPRRSSAFRPFTRRSVAQNSNSDVDDFINMAREFVEKHNLIYVNVDMRNISSIELAWNTLMHALYNVSLIRLENKPGIEHRMREHITTRDERNRGALLPNQSARCCNIL